MGKPTSISLICTLALAVSILLLSCAQGQDSGHAGPVAFEDLIADPQRHADQVLCTEGVQAVGFEASGLAASTHTEDGHRYLTEPVIWLEGADIQSREDCTRTDADPSYEFCHVVVCGVFETGGGYGHGGAYAHQLRGSNVTALPSPTLTLLPLPTVSQSDKTRVAPGTGGEGLAVEPPPAMLETSGHEQVSGIGSYCWTQPKGKETGLAICADMAGIPTVEEPLLAGTPFVATFRLAPEETPDQLLLEVLSVSDKDEFDEWPAGWRGWPFKDGERHNLPLEREPSIELSLEPGLYVLNLTGWWQAWGQASYGFLVKVQPPPPVLAVDESPVIAAAIDGPGHFEYTDRLGEQLLTRIEGLRVFADQQELARNNATLAPFGYRLEARFDAQWDCVTYDLFREGEVQPILAGLSQVWPVSVNASGTDFCLVAENAPNSSPLYLQVQAGGVEHWDADANAFLPPSYVGDALARVTFTGFPTLAFQVELDGLAVYSGTAVAQGAYMPLRSFTALDGHWVLGVDDRLIMDGHDLGTSQGYDAAFGFSLIHGRPFYFFQQGGQIRISFDGKTLPNVYDQVFHDQCCEAAIHNVENLFNAVLFHALWDGTWYFAEAGIYDGEMSSTYRYTAPEGWSFRYPGHWDRLDEASGFVQDTVTGKTVTFASRPTTQAELEQWLESQISRKLFAPEAENTLAEPLASEQKGTLTIYRYAILSRMEASETMLRTTVFFDGQCRYELHAAIPPVAEEEYEAIVTSLHPQCTLENPR